MRAIMSLQHQPMDKGGKLDLRPCNHPGFTHRTPRAQRGKKPELTFSMVNQRLFNRVMECLISILDELDDEDQKTRPVRKNKYSL